MAFAKSFFQKTFTGREWPMSTIADTAYIHDLALDTYRHLKAMEESPATKQHMLRMIFAVERAAADVMDDEGEEQALRDAEVAAQYCEPK